MSAQTIQTTAGDLFRFVDRGLPRARAGVLLRLTRCCSSPGNRFGNAPTRCSKCAGIVPPEYGDRIEVGTIQQALKIAQRISALEAMATE